jgi:hypothetical protein
MQQGQQASCSRTDPRSRIPHFSRSGEYGNDRWAFLKSFPWNALFLPCVPIFLALRERPFPNSFRRVCGNAFGNARGRSRRPAGGGGSGPVWLRARSPPARSGWCGSQPTGTRPGTPVPHGAAVTGRTEQSQRPAGTISGTPQHRPGVPHFYGSGEPGRGPRCEDGITSSLRLLVTRLHRVAPACLMAYRVASGRCALTDGGGRALVWPRSRSRTPGRSSGRRDANRHDHRG